MQLLEGAAELAKAARAQARGPLVLDSGDDALGFPRGRAGTLALLQEVLESVSIPVLAAGGIGSARGVAAALAAGAAGVRVGTRFVAAVETRADPRYVEALAAAHAEDTVLTDRFSPPGAPIRARALRTAVDEGQPFFAGESTGVVRGLQPAAEIVHELAEGARRLLLESSRLAQPAPRAIAS